MFYSSISQIFIFWWIFKDIVENQDLYSKKDDSLYYIFFGFVSLPSPGSGSATLILIRIRIMRKSEFDVLNISIKCFFINVYKNFTKCILP